MCGISAFWNCKNEEIISIMTKVSLRGRDSYGYYQTDLINHCTIKGMGNIENADIRLTNQTMVLVSGRATPSTEYETRSGFDIGNQQPFENEKYVVIHNGLIFNDKKLIKEFNLKPKSNVDSAILPELFKKIGVVEGLKKIKGSFAIICYDKIDNKLFVAKNFLPLRIIKTPSKLIFASIKEMFEINETSEELSPYSCYEFDLEDTTYHLQIHSLYSRERNKKVLVICSGGCDSVTVAYLYKYLGYEVGLLHFNYSQAAETSEQNYVEELSKKFNWKLIIYNAKEIFSPFKDISKLLYQKKANTEEKLLDSESDLSYVPNRNLIFTSIGAAVAEKLGYDTLAYGGNQEDAGAYSDNAIPYFGSLKTTLKYSLKQNTNIHFASPLINVIKWETVSLGKKLGVDFDSVVSCYYPKIVNGKMVRCHKCGCDLYLDNALKMSREKDIGDINDFINKYIKPFT